jgi:hypothetical protein
MADIETLDALGQELSIEQIIVLPDTPSERRFKKFVASVSDNLFRLRETWRDIKTKIYIGRRAARIACWAAYQQMPRPTGIWPPPPPRVHILRASVQIRNYEPHDITPQIRYFYSVGRSGPCNLRSLCKIPEIAIIQVIRGARLIIELIPELPEQRCSQELSDPFYVYYGYKQKTLVFDLNSLTYGEGPKTGQPIPQDISIEQLYFDAACPPNGDK